MADQQNQQPRPLHEIAAEIEKVWGAQGKGVNYAARPYLDAMKQLNKIGDNYFCDSGESVVLYFLANAQSFRGEDAKRIKAELKKMLDLTVVNLQNKAHFAGIWIRPRAQLPIGFGPATLKRFADEANQGAAVTREQIKADKALYQVKQQGRNGTVLE